MGLRDWHVTGCNLEHQNCVGVAKPSRSQLVASSVIRGTLSADPTTSAKTLVAQLRHQSNISASQHVMYRTKDTLTTEMFSEDPTKIQLLPSLLSEFQRLNPCTFTDFQCDERGRFRRALVVLDPKWFSDGPDLFGVDAAHMNHRKYNGVQIVLVGRDGNLRNNAAVALVPLEDYDNYTWFFGHIMRHGFSLESSPVFSDRNLGHVSVADNLKIFNMFCIRHIIGNMRSDKSVRLSVAQERFVWEANAATSRSDFDSAMSGLTSANSAAGAYLNAIPHHKWALYVHYATMPLYGWRTTNFVESEQAKSLRLKPRRIQPYEFFKSYTTILMSECYSRVQLAAKWVQVGLIVTPRVKGKFQDQLSEAAQYGVTFSSDSVAFVSRINSPLKERRVDTKQATCSCPTWKQHRIPCRHLIATLIAGGVADTAYELMGACYTVAVYLTSVGTLEVPEDNLLVRDSAILPSGYVRQAGRPKKRRIKSQDEIGGKARKPYKCTRCVVVGHNRATCRMG